MSSRHAAPNRRPGDLLVRLGAAVFVVGVVMTLVSVVPAILGETDAPDVPVVLAGVLLPLGFALALVGLLRGARTRRREAKRAQG